MQERAALGIFGAGRNGSTLLMRLLDGSPDLWIYPIELRFLELRDWLASEPGSLDRWAEGQLAELRETYLGRLEGENEPHADPLAALRASSGPPERRLEAFLDGVRAAYAPPGLSPEAIHGFKTIEVEHPGRYLELFPGLRLLHLVRDPSANYASLKRTDMVVKRKPFWFQGGDVLRTFLERRWLPHARYVLGVGRRDPARHLLVRYEELCSEPTRVVTEICDWLGIRPPAEPELQTALGGRHLREQPNRAPEHPVADMQRPADGVVTPREAAFIELATAELAAELGYERNGGATPSRARLLRSWLPLDRWETMNVDSRLRQGRALVARRLYVYRKLLSRP